MALTAPIAQLMILTRTNSEDLTIRATRPWLPEPAVTFGYRATTCGVEPSDSMSASVSSLGTRSHLSDSSWVRRR